MSPFLLASVPRCFCVSCKSLSGEMGSKEAFEINVRDVHMEALYPKLFGRPGERVIQSRRNAVARIQEKGMRP
jgi:hypothetical protein